MSAALAPDRTLTQRQAALVEANRIRTRRARFKLDLKAGRASIADVLIDPPEWARSWQVFDVLMAVPQYGRVRAGAVLKRVGVSPSKRLGGLTVRQRRELVGLLGV